MSDIKDPGDPSEGGGMRAKNLKNLPLIILPKSEGTAEGTDGPYDYVSCDVWVLDRSGIVDHGKDVQFAWRRMLEALRADIGNYVACRPIEDGGAVILVPLQGAAREVAAQALKEIEAGGTSATEPETF